MALSRNAAAFSIDALLCRPHEEVAADVKPDIKPAMLHGISDYTNTEAYPILDAALTKPFSQLRLQSSRDGEIGSRGLLPTSSSSQHQGPHEDSQSPATTPMDTSTGPDVESKPIDQVRESHRHASPLHGKFLATPAAAQGILNFSGERKLCKPPLIDADARKQRLYRLEHQLSIPSFKINDSNSDYHRGEDPDDTMGCGLKPTQSNEFRRHSSYSLAVQQRMDFGDATGFPTRRHSLACVPTDKRLAVDRWVRATASFMPTDPHITGSSGNLSSVGGGGEGITLSQIVDGIKVTLSNADLWRKFDRCGTEMILNRAGR